MTNSYSKQQGWIYFIKPIGLIGPYKIGFSRLPSQRLELLMAWSPFPLEIVTSCPGTFELERRIHGLLSAAHSHGEWFHPTDAVTKVVKGLASGLDLRDAIDLYGPIGALKNRAPKKQKTPQQKAYFSLRIRLQHAARRSMRVAGVRRYWSAKVDHELQAIRDGRLPADKVPAETLAYLNDPAGCGVSFAERTQEQALLGSVLH